MNRSHHRPSVRRLYGGLGTFRWVTGCTCGYYQTEIFWRIALFRANAHAQELK